MQPFPRVATAPLVASVALSPVYAQETRVTLSGTIIDPSGSAVTGAHVSLRNVENANRSVAETNQLGQYRFLFLKRGKYQLTVEMSGFRTLVREGIELNANRAATLDLALQIGTQAETITVAGEVPLLEAEKSRPQRRGANT
jgi:hypothetical protein